MENSDEVKINEFKESLKTEAFDGSTPDKYKVSEEEKGLDSFETSEPYKESLPEAKKALSSDEAQILQEAADKKKHRRAVRSDPQVKELSALTQTLSERLEYNEKYYANEIERLKKELTLKEKATHTLEDHSLKVKKDYLVNALIAAKEAENYEAEARIQDSLAALHADIATTDLRRNSATNEFEFNKYSPPKPVEIHVDDVAEPYANWLDRNSWASSDSPDYDEGLTTEANQIARDLNKRLKLKGQSHLINSETYYDAIDSYFKDKYGDSEQVEEEVQTPIRSTPRASTKVSPVNREIVSDRVDLRDNGAIYLSPEEKENALSMQRNHPNGLPFTDQEKLQFRAQTLKKLQEYDRRHGPSSSPHKTTLIF